MNHMSYSHMTEMIGVSTCWCWPSEQLMRDDCCTYEEILKVRTHYHDGQSYIILTQQ